MQNSPLLSLADKVRMTRERFDQLLDKHSPDTIHAAWTGGKDSTAVLHLWKEHLRDRGLEAASVRAVNIDTGVKFPEVLALRDELVVQWGIQCHVARPLVELKGYPLARDVEKCCGELKIAPLRKAILDLGVRVLLTGLRHDEHPTRTNRKWLEPRTDPDHQQCNPILEWTEMDIWAYTMEHGIPHCSLYDQGYRSLGCVPCTVAPDQADMRDERSGRSQEKERLLDQLRSLGYF